MKPEEQRIAIAEACGWNFVPSNDDGNGHAFPESWISEYGREAYDIDGLADYLNDLNACHEAWLTLDQDQRDKFRLELLKLTVEGVWLSGYHLDKYCNATAAQRCEAFLRVIGKWKD